MRYTDKYPYQSLRIGVMVITQDSLLLPMQTLDFQTADNQGNYLGVGKGGLFQLQANPFILPTSKSGTWKILLSHQMNDSSLVGIHDIGVKIGLARGK